MHFPLDPDCPMPKCLQGSGEKMLFATSTPSNDRSPEHPGQQLLLQRWLYLFYSVFNSDRKRGSSKIGEAFRYAKIVSFFFFLHGFAVWFFMEHPWYNRPRLIFENKMYIFFSWENAVCQVN